MIQIAIKISTIQKLLARPISAVDMSPKSILICLRNTLNIACLVLIRHCLGLLQQTRLHTVDCQYVSFCIKEPYSIKGDMHYSGH